MTANDLAQALPKMKLHLECSRRNLLRYLLEHRAVLLARRGEVGGEVADEEPVGLARMRALCQN